MTCGNNHEGIIQYDNIVIMTKNSSENGWGTDIKLHVISSTKNVHIVRHVWNVVPGQSWPAT